MVFMLKSRRPEKYRDNEYAGQVNVILGFKRDPERFGKAVIDTRPPRSEQIERLLDQYTGDVRKTLELALEGVPEESVQSVYERALKTALAASGRGEGETPVRELLSESQARDVTESAHGYGVSLDADEDQQEQRQRLENAIESVEAHNRRIHERIRAADLRRLENLAPSSES